MTAEGWTKPRIIQGGMGAAVSSWSLARAVSALGELGVVSGTGLDVVVTRRLQDGDVGGHLRRILEGFPAPALARRVLEEHFAPGGRAPRQPYRLVPLHTVPVDLARQRLACVANFAEVALAKEGHPGLVGINFLEKMQVPVLPSLLGAMLAGVDFVLMGAGLPREIPGALDALARGETASLTLHVDGAAPGDDFRITADPREILGGDPPRLRRPRFLGIVASATAASVLATRANGHVDGFVVQGPEAGGHQAPPRGGLRLTPDGQPVYGPRDVVDLDAIRVLGRPFWLAGGRATPERLREALALGASGIQVGTAFAYCRESGLRPDLKHALLEKSRRGEVRVFTDAKASPTGFPFKVALLEGTLSEACFYDARERVCDLGYLRELYKRPEGGIGFRCPAEPVDTYAKKGGDPAETEGRKCLCNALLANVGVGSVRPGGADELPLVTSGDDLAKIARLLRDGEDSYSAEDVIRYLRTSPTPARSSP
ncbi:MAG: nitronate monooxygenase [Planctomycetales bacterium]|nr:nitronate monooxygenase [Planctomycetales bacterium]